MDVVISLLLACSNNFCLTHVESTEPLEAHVLVITQRQKALPAGLALGEPQQIYTITDDGIQPRKYVPCTRRKCPPGDWWER